ncbi:glucokinase [Flammeovirgaceae bacterium 311]|nr:glucokinase [Flammeovirgaceae bacterium 311]
MINIAADLGGTSIKLGILNRGKLLATANLEALAHENIETNLTRLSGAAKELLAQLAIPLEQVNGIGLTFPGIVDSQQARVLSRYVKYNNAHEFDFRAWALQEWNVPLALENDARAALLGEWTQGAGKGCNNIVLLTLGTGVGSAALIEGKLLRGTHFLAGNLGGHMSVNVNGGPCNCGFFGCLETEASTWVLPEKAAKHPLFGESSLSRADSIGFATLFQEAERGDKLSALLLEDCLKAWGVGVVNMVHAYDPELIIIGGGIMKKKGSILPYLQSMVDRYAWAPAAGSVRIVSAEQVEYAGLLGMDYMVSQLS